MVHVGYAANGDIKKKGKKSVGNNGTRGSQPDFYLHNTWQE